MPSDDEEHDSHATHIEFGLPLAELMQQRARHEMAHEDLNRRLDAFFEGLDAEQLLMMRAILNGDRESAMNNYYDGFVVGHLRLRLGVDRNGESLDAMLEQTRATMDAERAQADPDSPKTE